MRGARDAVGNGRRSPQISPGDLPVALLWYYLRTRDQPMMKYDAPTGNEAAAGCGAHPQALHTRRRASRLPDLVSAGAPGATVKRVSR